MLTSPMMLHADDRRASDGASIAGRSDEPFVGVPFIDGGRTLDGADCWALVRLFLEFVAGVRGLDAYAGTPAKELAAVARDIDGAALSPTWLTVDRRHARRFDVVTLTGRERVNGRPTNLVCHVGVLVAPERLLHVEAATSSVIVPLGHASVRNRLAGFYRHRSLA